MPDRIGAAAALALGAAILAVGWFASAQPRCAQTGFSPQLLTPLGGRHPSSAAFVVGMAPGGTFRGPPPILMHRGRRDVRTVAVPIAPGLYRVSPDGARVAGRYTLTGVAGDPELEFGRVTGSAPPPAPRLERVERYRLAGSGAERTEVRAHVQFPIPDGVIAVVAYWGADSEPDLFARATPTQTEVLLYSEHQGCPPLPEGASAPPTQGDVRIAFVDAYGQISQPSDASSL
ncbi:MAG: hypothetical protein AB7S26_24595 [Sandaracinaceae bacterium]